LNHGTKKFQKFKIVKWIFVPSKSEPPYNAYTSGLVITKILAIQMVTKILSTLFDDQEFFSYVIKNKNLNHYCKLGLDLRLIFPFT
jgi:hypothetical protein